VEFLRRLRISQLLGGASFEAAKCLALGFSGQENDEIGEYELTRIGPRKTRLTMAFKEKPPMRQPKRKTRIQ
jgi:hypothetical protein